MRLLQLFIKRFIDIVGSLVLIVVLIPLLIAIPIWIRATSKGKAIFTQNRVGKGGAEFKIYKYRTMLIPEERIDKDGNELEPNDSITAAGRFLRKTSLDEIAQLFNVLKGDMSFIGPRPMLPTQVEKISEYEKGRHAMRPGVTGLAQVNGRNSLTWDKKLAYDMQYVENFSLWMDICIIFKTVKVVFAHEGIEYVHIMGDKK